MDHIFWGQFYQESKKCVIANIDSGYVDVVIDNVKFGDWNIWVKIIDKENFYSEYVFIYCKEDILTNHHLANYSDPNNWIYKDTIYDDAEFLTVYDEKYYDPNNNEFSYINLDYLSALKIMLNGVVFCSDYNTCGDIYLSKKQGKVIGIKIVRRECNDDDF